MKKHLGLLLLVLSTATNVLQAQTTKFDSLREVLKRDTTDFDVLKQLTLCLGDTNFVGAIGYARRAKSVALAQGDTSHIVTSSRLLGQMYNRQGDVNMAIKEMGPLLAIAERHHLEDEIKRIFNSLAIAFGYIGEYDKSLDYHLRSLALKEKDNDKKGVSVSLNNIGVVYFSVDNFDRALYYWEKCLALKLSIDDKYDLDALYKNLGLCYEAFGDFKKARTCFGKVFTTCSPDCSKRMILRTETAIGELELRQNKIKEARAHLEKSLFLAKQDNDLEFKMDNLLALANVAFAERNLFGVATYLNEFSSLKGKEQYVRSLQSFYKLSADYYSEIKKFRLADQYKRKYSRLAEKISSAEMHRHLMEIQINFIEKEHAEKLENQRKLVEAQAKVIRNRNIISLLLFGVAALTIILLVVFFKLNVKKTAINKRLDELVRQRTSELEKNRNELAHSYDEQKIVLEKISGNLTSSLATITGLVNVGRLEKFENAQTYLKATEDTLVRLVESVNWLYRRSAR